MGTRAAILARVSRDSAQSVDGQLRDSRAECAANAWDVPPGGEYIDNDKSASRFASKERPEWARLLADLERDGFDVIVMWEPSRGSRDLARWADFLDLCRRRGTLIHVVSHRRTYDVSVRRDWKTLAEEGLESADESEKISERVRRGWDRSAQAGVPHGTVPFGYALRYDPITKARSWIISEPAASIAREIIKRVAAGETLGGIRDDLNARRVPAATEGWSAAAVRAVGRNPAFAARHDPAVVAEILSQFPPETLPSEEYSRQIVNIRNDLNRRGVDPGNLGSAWGCQTVRTCAGNPAYAGLRKWKGDLIPGNWPAIIDPDISRQARERLEHRTGTRPGRARWLLSHLVACGVCGLPLTTRPGRTLNLTGQRIKMYTCEHGHVAWNMAEMDAHFEERLIGHLAHNGALRRRLLMDREGRSTDLVAAEAMVAALRKRLAEFKTAAIAGRISADSFADIEAGLRPQIREAEQVAARLTPPPALAGFHASSQARSWWKELALPARRDAIRSLARSMALHPVAASERLEIIWRD